jgi:hypothetical protein
MVSTSSGVSRRGLLGVTVAGLALGLPRIAIAADSFPVGQTRFRSVSVDTRGLAESGLPNYAVRIAKMAEPIVASVFANRLAPGDAGAPRLVLKINSISLDRDGNIGRTPFNLEDRDWISGGGDIVDGRGKVLRSAPIETSAGAFDPSGDVLTAENIRTERLITILAEWVDRSI